MGCRLEQKTMYFLMMPLSLRGGSQETNTTELLDAAAFTPAGGPGTGEEESGEGLRRAVRNIPDKQEVVSYCVMCHHCEARADEMSRFILLERVMLLCLVSYHTILFSANVDLLAADPVSSVGEGQDLDAVISVLLQSVQLQRRLIGGHIPDFSQF